MATLTILGGNSLLGQHVFDVVTNSNKFSSVRVWNHDSKAENRLVTNNNPTEIVVQDFVGMESLERAVEEVDAVINVHECRDFTTQPDVAAMNEQNVDFIQKLIEACHKGHVHSLLHLSSIFLQSTSLFPNVYGREAKPVQSKFLPFKAYVETKRRAEDLLINDHSDLQIVIARVGALYGEGDVCSPLCDAIYISDKLGFIPTFGDRGGVYQMTYAGNIANSLVDIASQLKTRVTIRREVVILRDDTPNEDIYSSTLIPMVATSSRAISNTPIPFFLFFPLICLFSTLNWFLNICGFNTRLNELPDPVYVYFLFRHWTYFSDFKQRIFFGQKPLYSYEEVKARCADYYSKLPTDQIRRFSWQQNSL